MKKLHIILVLLLLALVNPVYCQKTKGKSKKQLQSEITSLQVTIEAPWYATTFAKIVYLLLFVFAIVSPVKVLNMILGGGILRSGGKTRIIMVIDIIGTWGFGVPLGCLSAFVFELPIAYVYFILSLEEVVRLVISFVVFRKRKWMQSL